MIDPLPRHHLRETSFNPVLRDFPDKVLLILTTVPRQDGHRTTISSNRTIGVSSLQVGAMEEAAVTELYYVCNLIYPV
jgi:hypothetical protein